MWSYLDNDITPKKFSMVWYMVEKTLSPYGTVNRGVCSLDKWKTVLQSVVEHHKIARDDDWKIRDEFGKELENHTVVSMNFWWFDNSIFAIIQDKFDTFLQEYGTDPKKEFYIPTVCDELIKSWTHICDVMISTDVRCGVTYPEDKTYVRSIIEAIVDWWTYPQKLW